MMIIIIWELVYKIGVDILRIWKPYSFPSPEAVIITVFDLLKDYTLIIAIISSIKRLAIGYLISVILGTLIGLLMVRFKYIDENFRSLILGFQTLPSLAWLPFAILWYGLNESAIIFVTAVGSIFAISLAVESGIKNINPIYLKAARTMGANGFKLYWNVILPAALPNIITGLKEGWSFAWRSLIAGEMLTATVGLGQILMIGRELSDINQVVAVMLVILVLGLIVDKIIFWNIEESVRYRWGLSIRKASY